jgi:hypothetical protein
MVMAKAMWLALRLLWPERLLWARPVAPVRS